MGKRYFCDYCDRSFQDNLHNRKKHLNGLQHLKAKKVWYDMFRDAAAILLDEQNKRPCRKFLLTGQCDFGSNCRFSHMSERDLQELSIQVEEERRAREWLLDAPELPEGHLEDWLEKRAKRLSSAPSSRPHGILCCGRAYVLNQSPTGGHEGYSHCLAAQCLPATPLFPWAQFLEG
ncbi:zinc finger matrin-type protein 5 isoform X1 [Gorilla gorilla gorilla]|uniref:zinc finger matrin-type protein 5 isoform X1 n=1 Tax=Gorilla gorilla gorilla TaxID=9595 RepID=UPI0005CFF8D6